MAVFMRHLLPGSAHKFCFSKIEEGVGGELLKTVSFKLPSRFERNRVVGYCEGLFCLEIDNGEIIVLNPSNRTYESLPSPTNIISPISGCPFPYCDKPCTVHSRCKPYTSTVVCGFGRAINTDEFKVIARVVTYFDDFEGEYDNIFKQVYVYTLGMNCSGWTEIECPQNSFVDLIGDDGYTTWVGGCCYWMAQSSTNDPNRTMYWGITKLDLATLKFSRIEVPCSDTFSMQFILMELNDSLGVIAYISGAYAPRRVRTWLFEEDRGVWSELETSPVQISFDSEMEFEKVLGWLNTCMIFIGLGYTHLLVYDCDGKKLWTSDVINDLRDCMLFPFLESSLELKQNYLTDS